MTSENIFFDTSKLKYRGQNVIIGKTCRIRYPEMVELHDNVIIDDLVYISTGLTMHSYSSIESHCVLMGNQSHRITIGSYSAVAPHVSFLCSSNDFTTSFGGGFDSTLYQSHLQGNITLDRYVIVGCNSTLLPGIHINEGARVGAHSLVKKDLEAWKIYAGNPTRFIKDVDQDAVLAKIKKFEDSK
jgi:acetyltransferase-like isoleucine patch superfamily enzyme